MKTLLSALCRARRPNESIIRYVVGLMHLWVGLLTGLLVVIISLTGCIYVWKNQAIKIVDRKVASVQSDVATDYSIDDVFTTFSSTYGVDAGSLVIPESGNKNMVVAQGRGANKIMVYASRSNGKIVGESAAWVNSFFSNVMRLHRWLLVRNPGKTIVGYTILLYLLMIVTGFVIWIPKKVKDWNKVLSLRLKGHWVTINYDLHSSLGFYSIIPLFILAVTGLCFSFGWMRSGVLDIFKDKQAQPLAELSSTDVEGEMDRLFAELLSDTSETKKVFSWDKAIKKSYEEFPYEGKLKLNTPSQRNPNYVITKTNTQNFWGAHLPDQIEFDESGEVVAVNRFADKELFQKVDKLIYPIHTGEVCGFWSQVLAFLFTFTSMSLPISGFIIWYKKSFP